MRSVQWSRVFAVYFVLALAFLIAGLATPPPLHRLFLLAFALLLGGFVPLIMGIYFYRGFRGNWRRPQLQPR